MRQTGLLPNITPTHALTDSCYDMDHRQLAAKYASQLNDASRRITELEAAVADSQELAVRAKANSPTAAQVDRMQKQMAEAEKFASIEKAHNAALTGQLESLERANMAMSASLYLARDFEHTLRQRLDEASKKSQPDLSFHNVEVKRLQQTADRERKRRLEVEATIELGSKRCRRCEPEVMDLREDDGASIDADTHNLGAPISRRITW
ncbi:hypothetical protein LTR53_006904 [Teratosphaeriaceae sp. CCFEE 6253]|nr:hypothetical protein LTR53_006904 [Teratosphaeriaceae sp. CCFEE 6253]